MGYWKKNKTASAVLFNNCPALLEEMGVYSWDMKAAVHGVEKPVKEYDHSLDVLRYYVNYLPGWRTETWR